MRNARLSLSVATAALAALLLAPSAALASEPLAVSGTVVRDGQPVTGVNVVVTVAGSDIIAAATTDELGAFSVSVDAAIPAEVRIVATGQTTRTGPDARGCVRSETPRGALTAMVDAVPPVPLTVDLATVLTSEVCSATGTPRPPTPRITPPATDGVVGPAAAGGATGVALVLAVLSLAGAGSLLAVRRRP